LIEETEPKRRRRSRPHPSRISVDEIREDLGLGPQRVYEMLEAKIIPNVKLGRTWIITRFAYENWKKNCGQTGRIMVA